MHTCIDTACGSKGHLVKKVLKPIDHIQAVGVRRYVIWLGINMTFLWIRYMLQISWLRISHDFQKLTSWQRQGFQKDSFGRIYPLHNLHNSDSAVWLWMFRTNFSQISRNEHMRTLLKIHAICSSNRCNLLRLT